jgi:hypothetical protein
VVAVELGEVSVEVIIVVGEVVGLIELGLGELPVGLDVIVVEVWVEELTVELVVAAAATVVVVDILMVTIQEQADDIRDGILEHCET